MNFTKYMHVERLGNVEVEGILDGTCYIFPKLDGTNGSIYFKDGEVRCGSRNRELTTDSDNQGFCKFIEDYCEKHSGLKDMLEGYGVVLYGEWLKPHTLKTYEATAWNRFYVFDMYVPQDDEYVDYENIKRLFDEFIPEGDIQLIPPLAIIKNPTQEDVIKHLDNNTYLIQDGKGYGEGVVIKNYTFSNKYRRTVWAKIVRNNFRTLHRSSCTKTVNGSYTIEREIADKYLTPALLEKEYQKIAVEGWSSKSIPRLLSTMYYVIVKEELWRILKDLKNPIIHFKDLQRAIVLRIKELKPELF